MEETTKVEVSLPPTEHRQAYGTAKTENLRDSGLWRILLPLVVVAGCAALIAVPLIFLVPLLVKSFDPTNPANVQGDPLTWLWIVMILLILAVDTIIIRGLLKIFFTQAGNYR
jgi:hypothetical protein